MKQADKSDLRQGAKSEGHGFDRAPQEIDEPHSPQLFAQAEMFSGGGDVAGGFTVFELVAGQLEQAHRTLHLQHDRVLQLLTQRPVSTSESNLPYQELHQENRVLREQLAQLTAAFAKKDKVVEKLIDCPLPANNEIPPPPSTVVHCESDVPQDRPATPQGGAPEMVDGEAAKESRLVQRAMSKSDKLQSSETIGSSRSASVTTKQSTAPVEHHAFTQLDIWKTTASKVTQRGPSMTIGSIDSEQNTNDLQHAGTAYLDNSRASQIPPVAAFTSKGCCRRFIVNPNDLKRTFWDLASMFLVLHDMIMIPFGFFDPVQTTGFVVTGWITRIYWTFDMPVSFLSGYITNDGTLEMRPSRIAKKYLKSWFALDCLVVGVDWIEIILSSASEALGFARIGKASRIMRILRLLRLLRLAKVSEIVSLVLEKLPSAKLVIFIDIIKLIVIMLGFGHFLACIWYAIGKAGPSGKNWLEQFDFLEAPLEYRYIMSLRWALSQFAGGMDEVTPQSMSEHLFAAAVYLTAFWSGTVFLSILTSHMTQLYILGNQQSQQLNTMRRYLSQNGISKGLALRVTRNAQHAMKMSLRTTPESSVTLISVVSEPLRIELHFEMYFPMLSVHPFFHEYYRHSPHVVRKICHAAMHISANSVGDVVFHFGEQSDKMMILKAGIMKYSWGHGHTLDLEPGTFIAEAPLWTSWVHRGVLSAVEDSITFHLSATGFHRIVSAFEGASNDPAQYAEEFVERLNTSEEVTDLPFAEDDSHVSGWRSWRNAQSTVLRATKMSTLKRSVSDLVSDSTRRTPPSEEKGKFRREPSERQVCLPQISEDASDSETEDQAGDKCHTNAKSDPPGPSSSKGVLFPGDEDSPRGVERMALPMTPEPQRFHQQGAGRKVSQAATTSPITDLLHEPFGVPLQGSLVRPRASRGGPGGRRSPQMVPALNVLDRSGSEWSEIDEEV